MEPKYKSLFKAKTDLSSSVISGCDTLTGEIARALINCNLKILLLENFSQIIFMSNHLYLHFKPNQKD